MHVPRLLSGCNHLDFNAIRILAIECVVFGSTGKWVPIFVQEAEIVLPYPERYLIDLLA